MLEALDEYTSKEAYSDDKRKALLLFVAYLYCMQSNWSMTEPHIPSASGQAVSMAEFPTHSLLSTPDWGAGTGIRTHSIVTVYTAMTFRSDTTAPRGQPLKETFSYL